MEPSPTTGRRALSRGVASMPSANTPRRHHYVPQFYLRRFACPDDANKVMVLEQHRDVLVADRKSIDRVGYEEALHDYDDDSGPASIEGDLNRLIETPFATSATWSKISSGASDTLSTKDKLPIYMFARHLQRRNLETLRFIETEHARVRAEGFDAEIDGEERDMHRWIEASADGAHALFRQGAIDIMPPADASAINVMICRSPIALRTSTNPTLIFSHPGEDSVFGPFFKSLRTWWLTLDRQWGAFVVAGGPPGFSNNSLPLDAARVINQRYLVQHQNSLSVRYLIADDDYLAGDLEWAGYRHEQRTTRGFRYRKASA